MTGGGVPFRAKIQLQIGAGRYERNAARLTHRQRNGYRPRRWDTRVGTLDLRIPKVRDGRYFPALLEPRRRSEQALLAVIQQAYVEGVSTRRVEDLVQALGCEGISKREVSRICQQLDAQVRAFRERPLDACPYPYVWLDALTQKVREDGRVVNVAVVVATAVNRDGARVILGLDIGASEDGAFWLSFLRSLAARGLAGAQLVVSDAHQGLKDAIAAVFTGASWQRCRTHFMTNLLSRIPKSAHPVVAPLVRTIYAQSTSAEVWAQQQRVVAQLAARFPDGARFLADAGPELLAFTAFPSPHWRQIWSNNPQERLHKEIRRRVVRVCRAWACARSTVYAQEASVAPLHPPGKRGPKTALSDAALTDEIRAVLAASPFTGEGHRKVWARLRHAGTRTSKPRVLRLMRLAGLLAPTRAGNPHGPRAHDGTIVTTRPDEVWGTDATSCLTDEGVATVFIAVDHCTAEAVGIHAARKGTRFEALEPLQVWRSTTHPIDHSPRSRSRQSWLVPA